MHDAQIATRLGIAISELREVQETARGVWRSELARIIDRLEARRRYHAPWPRNKPVAELLVGIVPDPADEALAVIAGLPSEAAKKRALARWAAGGGKDGGHD
jgi:hypothetical protein